MKTFKHIPESHCLSTFSTTGQPLMSRDIFIMEIWKDVKGYEGLYQVSNLGRIKSLPRSWFSGRSKKIIKTHTGFILRPGTNRGGYLIAQLTKDGVKKGYSVHRLVIENFTHKSHLIIDHINGVKTDNRLVNLRYCTNRENQGFDNVKRKNDTSKYQGVGFHKSSKKWRARIFFNKKSIYLGVFLTEEDAAVAYENKRKEIESL